MSHVSPKLKEGWIPCEFAAMGDCATKDGETCDTHKDPDDCEKYHRKMVAEGEEKPDKKFDWGKLSKKDAADWLKAIEEAESDETLEGELDEEIDSSSIKRILRSIIDDKQTRLSCVDTIKQEKST